MAEIGVAKMMENIALSVFANAVYDKTKHEVSKIKI